MIKKLNKTTTNVNRDILLEFKQVKYSLRWRAFTAVVAMLFAYFTKISPSVKIS